MGARSESNSTNRQPAGTRGGLKKTAKDSVRALEHELQQAQWTLSEKTKEMDCLYHLSDLAERRELPIEQLLQAVAEALPRACQRPEQARGQICYRGKTYSSSRSSADFGPFLSNNLYVQQRLVGQVQVGYNSTPAGLETQPFLPGERRLLTAVAERLGKIIERRKAEQSNLFLESMVNTLDEAIIGRDEQGRVINWSLGAQRIYGYTAEEMLGNSASLLIPPDRMEESVDILARVHRGQIVDHLETERIRKDGQRVRVYLTVLPVCDTQGQVVGVTAIAQDLTADRRADESLRLEEEIVRREKMEELARRHEAELAHVGRLSMLGEMASMLAHELNQPLSAIMNYAHGCARRLEASQPNLAQLQRAMNSIATEAERAGQIIRRTRAFVRKGTSERTVCDMNRVIREAVSFADSRITQNQVRVTLQLADDLPLLQADAIQLEQVVLNLIHNAVEAMSGCPVPIRQLWLVSETHENQDVQVTVADTGPGIPEADLARVFDPFFTTKKSGLGMGLSISRSIVEAHHGRMWVTRPVEGGCAFHFRLPCTGVNHEQTAQ